MVKDLWRRHNRSCFRRVKVSNGSDQDRSGPAFHNPVLYHVPPPARKPSGCIILDAFIIVALMLQNPVTALRGAPPKAWRRCAALVGLAMAAAGPGSAAGALRTVRSGQVIAAIKKGAEYLLQREKAGTFWEGPYTGHKWFYNETGGETALVTEALLDIGQGLPHVARRRDHVAKLIRQLNAFNPRMNKAIAYLLRLRTPATYATSFQANALTLLPRRRKFLAVLRGDAQFLLRSIHRDGGYHYVYNLAGWDNSNSQYGVLGMWACAHAGLNIPPRYWLLAAHHWRSSQYIDGSWGYMPHPGAVTAARGMQFTPAGVASLFICDEFLGARHVPRRPVADPNILAGLRWMDEHFNPAETNFYAMYGDERVGMASGLQTFGGHNWYKDFAYTLVHQQAANGSWSGNFIGATPVVSTAYALLLLARGLNPVFMNKLQYSRRYYGPWNARPRDDANVTAWVSRNFEAPMNWQVVNIHTPVSNWLDCPLLFITGYRAPHFSAAAIAKLRAYVDAGGMVFCSSAHSYAFERAMLQVGRQVAQDRYPPHPLAPSATLYHLQPWYHFRRNMRLTAISNGVRYLWLVTPIDFGAVWQRRAFDKKDFWELPANLYWYATGKGYLANRLKSLRVPPPTAPPVHRFTMAQLEYAGNWNPEPGAWPRLAALARTYFQTRVTLRTLTGKNPIPSAITLVHLTGTEAFKLSTQAERHLRTYLHAGGLLFADAAGGKAAFTNAFTTLAGELWPGAPLVALPPTSAIYRGAFPGGVPATTVRYRKYYLAMRNVRHARRPPHLLGVKAGGRWVILFSPWDITSGLLGTNTWGIAGYTPASAQKLARDILLYAQAHRPPTK